MAEHPFVEALRDPAAAQRRMAIDRLVERGEARLVDSIRPLLEDDAPVVVGAPPRRFIIEVRFRALEAMCDLYRQGGMTPEFGAVKTRKAMPVAEAERLAREAMLARSPAERQQIQSAATAFLNDRVRPSREDRAVLLSYRILQTLGLLEYREEEVNPETYATPLMAEVRASQVQSVRPRPNLRVAAMGSPDRVLGYVYATDGGWSFDFADDFEAADARQFIERIFSGIEPGGVPRLVAGPDGSPLKDDKGAFVLDGILPRDGRDADEVLFSLHAFADGIYDVRIEKA